MRSAIAVPNTNPLDSMATIAAASVAWAWAHSSPTVYRNASGSPNSGVMSLNKMPSFGKSGTARMLLLRSTACDCTLRGFPQPFEGT